MRAGDTQPDGHNMDIADAAVGIPESATAAAADSEAERDKLLDFYMQSLPTVEAIYFAGGEPLLAEEHYTILSELLRLGRRDVALYYSTNGSVTSYGGRDVLSLWRQFRQVKVTVSIDHFDEKIGYMRSGVDWRRLLQNIRSVRQSVPHVEVYCNITVSNMNVYDLPEVIERLRAEEIIAPSQPDNFFLQIVYTPAWYHPATLPAEFKKLVIARLQAFQNAQAVPLPQIDLVLQSLASDHSAHIERFIATTRALDEIRGESFAETFPALHQSLDL